MSDPTSRLARIDSATAALSHTFGAAPDVAIVLGSGLGEVAQRVADARSADYAALGFPRTSVGGHVGRAVVGRMGGKRVMLLQGRAHVYEGHGADEAALAVRACARWGVRGLVLTSAVGGVDPSLGPGTITVISDHLNLSGTGPLEGPNLDALGPRFPDLTHLYSPRLRGLAQAASPTPLPEAVYACMRGPSYETPAEIRMLRTLGADVVGMSMIHEAIAASHAGMEVLGFSVVSNFAAGLSATVLTHEEVTEASRQAAGRLGAILVRVVEAW